VKSADHDGNRTGREKDESPLRRTQARIFANDEKDKEDDAKIRDDAGETKEEGEGEAVWRKNG